MTMHRCNALSAGKRTSRAPSTRFSEVTPFWGGLNTRHLAAPPSPDARRALGDQPHGRKKRVKPHWPHPLLHLN